MMLKQGWFLLAAVLAAGCSSVPLYDAPFVSGPDVKFVRNMGFFGLPETGRCLTTIFVDRYPTASVDVGQNILVELKTGVHKIEAQTGGGNCPKYMAAYYVNARQETLVNIHVDPR